MGVIDKDIGWDKIMRDLNDLDGTEIVAGILKDAGNGSRGTPYADIAIYNEYGTKNIPSRPAVRIAADENGNKCIDYIPCYMPAYKRSLIQDFLVPRRDNKTGEEWWEVDYEKMKGNEDLLEMIGYRI